MRVGNERPVFPGVERIGPPDGGPARVVRHERAGAGPGERGADRETRRSGGSAATRDLPGLDYGGP